MPRDAVFLDRDGTLIEDVHYLARPDQVRLIPGAAAAVRALNDAGALVVVVTNQAGVARGLFPESRVAEVHRRLSELLAQHGAKVDAFYHCPHHPEGLGGYRVACACRKPEPGMLLAAARDLDIDLARSWMVGDKPCDAGAGRAAGCRTLLVRTGHGAELAGGVDDLAAAAAIVLQSRGRGPAA
ncbi:MAG: D-glycero-alpha-D-manno-heptose-1,7-bisphosphate 7-phosphatase [Gemmata sp.]